MTEHYVDKTGKYIGAYADGAQPNDPSYILLPEGEHPTYASQIWLFPGWTEPVIEAAETPQEKLQRLFQELEALKVELGVS